jgi:hypothetical protein
MKRFVLLFAILFLLSFAQAQTEVASAEKPTVELAYPYMYEIKTQDGKLYYCHEIEAYDQNTALMVTYKTMSDNRGCRLVKLQTFLPLADIKYTHSIAKFK